jgi:putative glutamine amidotransferase
LSESSGHPSSRPIIGLATQTLQPIPGQAPLSFVMGQQYVRVLSGSGAIPWIIPLLLEDEATLRAIYDQIDGVFLAGGVDVEPSAYGEHRSDWCGPSDPARDAVERSLLHWAAIDKKPVLGVCRGVQMINVAFGGTLMQDIEHDRPQSVKHDYFPQQGFNDRAMLVHAVRTEPGSRLYDLLGESVSVNSLHHQGIKQLADGLVATAAAPDGVIEGVEGANGQFLLGVQWHPEELVHADDRMKRVFQAFLSAAVEFRNSKSSNRNADGQKLSLTQK